MLILLRNYLGIPRCTMAQTFSAADRPWREQFSRRRRARNRSQKPLGRSLSRTVLPKHPFAGLDSVLKRMHCISSAATSCPACATTSAPSGPSTLQPTAICWTCPPATRLGVPAPQSRLPARLQSGRARQAASAPPEVRPAPHPRAATPNTMRPLGHLSLLLIRNCRHQMLPSAG